MKPSQLKTYLAQKQNEVDRALDSYLPSASEKPKIIHQAMRYSVFAGGKRLRPILVLAAADICGHNSTHAMPMACAFELIHTYSLIHDDLPAMDDDDLRRGKPTNHKVFGEDIAILAGDALLTQAFHLISRHTKNTKRVPELINILAQSAGSTGMIGGQVADITADKGRWRQLQKNSKNDWKTPQRLLSYIHLHKTAALIQASIEAGAVIGQASAKQRAALKKYGEHIGLAFQIQDDILDKIGDKKKLGKRGSDADNKKLTFVTLYGIETSKRILTEQIKKAHQSLALFNKNAVLFHQLADYLAIRDY